MDEHPEKKIEKETLAAGHAVLVQYDGARCMAFRDGSGKWRDYFNGELLPGTVKVLEELF